MEIFNKHKNYFIKMKPKKSQGLSLNAIIIAIMVLVVLVVLIAIFTGRAGIFSKTIKSCEQNGGTCVSTGECEGSVADFECSESKICCISTGGLT
jgi:uncharacterized membrane protein